MRFRSVFLLATTATALVALWLFSVIVLVLPARDPSHIPMWSAVAIGLVAYSALSFVHVLRRRRSSLLSWSVVTMSVVAIGFGISGIVEMMRRDNPHFEGYVVLMGLILCGHAASAILYTVLARSTAPAS